MALTRLLVVFPFVLTFSVAALAQFPAPAMAIVADCCATTTDDGTALATSVLLPPPSLTLPFDERDTALAASVLLPKAEPVAHAATEMRCCGHDHSHGAPAMDMKGGCDMPGCQGMAPAAPPDR